jgi:hypothetical protein
MNLLIPGDDDETAFFQTAFRISPSWMVRGSCSFDMGVPTRNTSSTTRKPITRTAQRGTPTNAQSMPILRAMALAYKSLLLAAAPGSEMVRAHKSRSDPRQVVQATWFQGPYHSPNRQPNPLSSTLVHCESMFKHYIVRTGIRRLDGIRRRLNCLHWSPPGLTHAALRIFLTLHSSQQPVRHQKQSFDKEASVHKPRPGDLRHPCP